MGVAARSRPRAEDCILAPLESMPVRSTAGLLLSGIDLVEVVRSAGCAPRPS